MHYYLFDKATRSKLRLPAPSQNGELFQKIAVSGNFIMSMKTVQIGPGVVISNEDTFRRIKWNDDDTQNTSLKTKTWYNDVKHLVTKDRRHLRASPRMLMGMLNAGSTTLGLLAVNHRIDQEQTRVVTLRLNDDSMSLYLSNSASNNRLCIEANRKNLEMIDINLSLDKTFIFKEGIGEYTSWYMDLGFVTVQSRNKFLRPQGKNPPDDFSISKGTATALSTLTINHIGAKARLRIGVDNVRRLWRIKKDYNKRKDKSEDVLLLSDGGWTPWNVSNCHLMEVPLKETKITTEEEKTYMLRCMNPDNPFSEDPEEEMTYSKEHGYLITEEIEVPRTIFHYVKRSNRTVN
ncbi:hypothetical protein B7P43_CG03716, partial [Cryptotermes secundus]